MKPKFYLNWKIVLAVALLYSPALFAQEECAPPPSFAEFDYRASCGENLSVVFFGGALTQGAGASNPERTSFRALLENYLKERYPAANFAFHDAAVGGAGSKLGMFRIDRDVLAYHPALVFIDFTIDVNLEGTDGETLGSYEQILRDLTRNGIPVVQIILGTKNYFGPDWTHMGPPRYRDHLEMGKLFHAAIGDSFPAIEKYLRKKQHNRNQIWPAGETDPDDLGHQIIFEATRDGLEKAICDQRIGNLPMDKVFAAQYQNRLQIFPASLPFPLPAGWRAVEVANGGKHTLAVCDASARDFVKPLRFDFNGTFLGILGETDDHGLGFKVLVDDQPAFYKKNSANDVWPSSNFGGSGKIFWHKISSELEAGRHTVEILPVFPEGVEQGTLRIESICVAGPDPKTEIDLSAAP